MQRIILVCHLNSLNCPLIIKLNAYFSFQDLLAISDLAPPPSEKSFINVVKVPRCLLLH
jgi:hypothetical protein